jgi:salicylate hydroxylase
MLKSLNISADIQDTDQAAYRIVLNRTQLAHDPDLLELIDSGRVVR